MSSTDPRPRPDVRDMYAIHNAFRRALSELPGQIDATPDGDTARAEQLASYTAETLWLLHVHHGGEDALVYPLLIERAPEHNELFEKMEGQHQSVTASIEATQAAAATYGASHTPADGRMLSEAGLALLAELDVHLVEEETAVLPLAEEYLTVEEWAMQPPHALMQYQGERIWLPFGLVYEAVPPEQKPAMFGQLPPPVQDMWTGGGADAFAAEMASIRLGA